MSYRDTDISSFSIYNFLIVNSGNQPILKEDFDEPLSISINSMVVPKAYLYATSPACLSPVIVYSDSINAFVIQPLLLNAGDSFYFRIIALNPPPVTNMSVNGRIAGISDLMFKSDSVSAILSKYLIISFLLLLVLVLLFLLIRRILEYHRAYIQLQKVTESSNSTTHINQITPEDVKSSLLLMRIDLEELLLRIGIEVNIEENNLLRSTINLAGELNRMEIISDILFEQIKRITPIIDRELHQSKTYLTPVDYSKVTELCNYLIASLREILNGIL